MNKELYMVFVPAVSWLLFALGGTQISDKVKGWKGWRRFILPFTYWGACLIAGFIWQSIVVAGWAVGAFVLPYGEKTSYIKKFFVGLSYALMTISIGISWWNLATVIGFITLFKLSNTKLTSNIFVWKLVEGSFGLLCGIQLSYLLAGHGLIW